MELHEVTKNIMETGKTKQLANYMKNYTSSPLNTPYDLLKVSDTIWTEVSS